jgi:hypothetical protein
LGIVLGAERTEQGLGNAELFESRSRHVYGIPYAPNGRVPLSAGEIIWRVAAFHAHWKKRSFTENTLAMMPGQ